MDFNYVINTQLPPSFLFGSICLYYIYYIAYKYPICNTFFKLEAHLSEAFCHFDAGKCLASLKPAGSLCLSIACDNLHEILPLCAWASLMKLFRSGKRMLLIQDRACRLGFSRERTMRRMLYSRINCYMNCHSFFVS